MEEQSPDFFVSYTQSDRRWAEWIAWQLESAGYGVIIQAWDFVPGSNWVVGMEIGMTRAARTIAILSPSYLESVFGKTEWRGAFISDPDGFRRKLVPIRVLECERPGLLGQVVSFDLINLSQAEARELLISMIQAVLDGRAKPSTEPAFPGARGDIPERAEHHISPEVPKFPGRGVGDSSPEENPRRSNDDHIPTESGTRTNVEDLQPSVRSYTSPSGRPHERPAAHRQPRSTVSTFYPEQDWRYGNLLIMLGILFAIETPIFLFSLRLFDYSHVYPFLGLSAVIVATLAWSTIDFRRDPTSRSMDDIHNRRPNLRLTRENLQVHYNNHLAKISWENIKSARVERAVLNLEVTGLDWYNSQGLEKRTKMPRMVKGGAEIKVCPVRPLRTREGDRPTRGRTTEALSELEKAFGEFAPLSIVSTRKYSCIPTKVWRRSK